MATASPLTDAAPAPAEFELAVGGMTCAACAARVQAKLNKVDGVTATVNLTTERAHITAPAHVPASDLVAVVEAAGSKVMLTLVSTSAARIPEAQVRLGRMLLEGHGVARDANAALACFEAAAERGSADAQNMAGRCYENGWGTERDFAQAAQLYRPAAEAGLATLLGAGA